jgi:phage tail sheath protein FI
MSDPIFGIAINTIDNEPRPAVVTNMSIVGLVGTAPNSDADDYPRDIPFSFFSDDTTVLAALGSDGTIYDAVAGINQQLGEFQVAAQIVCVIVDEGESVAETLQNLIGDINAKTGMYALLDAGTLLGVTPRLICVPGYTSQSVNGIGAINVTNAGSGYTSAPAVAFSGGGGTGAAGTAVLGTGPNAGKVVGVTITNPGNGYTSAPTIAFSGGAGAGAAATVVVDTASNPIVAGLPTLLDRLFAVAVVDGPATTMTAAINWRETISSKRIIPVDPAVKILDDAQVVVVPASPYIIGIAVKRDHEFQGRPFHSWANQAIGGIVGASRPIAFSILDGATEGQALLAQNIGVIVRGENTDGAIADGGYVYVGTDTCSEDTLWQFYNQVRGRDYIHLIFIKTLRYYLGRFNITAQTIQSVLNTMTFALRDIQAEGDLLGFRVGFTRDKNSPEQLRLGRFTVGFQAEEPPVLRHLGIESARYRPALDALLDDLIATLDVNA